ncbi:MAG: hypothetical protein DSZ05_09370 [Sulfurospirillum sp.]|nr:MAG: hypothetical protein DSZ05_09370 [Sulfurospirillum sp.]
MNDFTKIKLINNLIDLVDYFYENKRKNGSASQIKYLKGFSEGIAHTLVEMSVIDSAEAKRILKGIGKRRKPVPETPESAPAPETVSPAPKPQRVETPPLTSQSLDVPTIFRQQGGKKSEL